MKKDIHPKGYQPVIFVDNSNGAQFLIASTVKTSEKAKWTDGKEYPVPEAAGIVGVSTWKDRTLESIARKDGAEIGRSTYTVSADGKTLTATVKGVDAAGRTFEQVILFDRM